MEFTVPDASDLNTKQLFQFFKKVMLAMGYAEKSIAVGAMSIVFNGDGDEAMQKAMCDEFDLTLNEDLQDKFEDFKKTEAEWDRINKTDYKGLVAEMQRNMDETEWDRIDKLVIEHHGAGPEDYNKTQGNKEPSND